MLGERGIGVDWKKSREEKKEGDKRRKARDWIVKGKKLNCIFIYRCGLYLLL